MSREALDRVFREEAGVVLATLIGSLRDFDLAEEAFADAMAAAVEHWPRDGVPDKPAAWLVTTAKRRAIDRLRHGSMRAGKEVALRATELERRMRSEEDAQAAREQALGAGLDDERLRLIFTCCHPALNLEAQVALTLRTLGGLSTNEVARAFLAQPAAMARRLGRAKKKIREAAIPYRVPPADALPERQHAVLAVVYLIFNQGYGSAQGAPAQRALCAEAIRLGRIVAKLLPSEPEPLGLLALMLLHDARRAARVDAEGHMIPLEEQDPARWNAAAIREGLDALARAHAHGCPGPYQVQAAISAAHVESTQRGVSTEERWSTVAGLYEALARMAPSPVVTLNRAVAVGRVQGPDAGLALLDALTGSDREQLEAYQPFHAARADLLRRAGRAGEAATAYRRAIALADSAPERRFLAQRLAELDG